MMASFTTDGPPRFLQSTPVQLAAIDPIMGGGKAEIRNGERGAGFMVSAAEASPVCWRLKLWQARNEELISHGRGRKWCCFRQLSCRVSVPGGSMEKTGYKGCGRRALGALTDERL